MAHNFCIIVEYCKISSENIILSLLNQTQAYIIKLTQNKLPEKPKENNHTALTLSVWVDVILITYFR